MMVLLPIAVLALALLWIRSMQGSRAAPEGIPAPSVSGAAPGPLPGGHNEFDDVIRSALARAGIAPDEIERMALLSKAIIQHESGWNAQARGDLDPAKCPQQYRAYAGTAGYCALGLGQIHRHWHPDLAAGYDLMNPQRNIAAMAVLLSRLRAALGSDVERIAAAYNGGTSQGRAWPDAIAQVRRYVASVTANYTRWAAEVGVA